MPVKNILNAQGWVEVKQISVISYFKEPIMSVSNWQKVSNISNPGSMNSEFCGCCKTHWSLSETKFVYLIKTSEGSLIICESCFKKLRNTLYVVNKITGEKI